MPQTGRHKLCGLYVPATVCNVFSTARFTNRKKKKKNAIAFAIAIAFGKNSGRQNFKWDEMRAHLVACFIFINSM